MNARCCWAITHSYPTARLHLDGMCVWLLCAIVDHEGWWTETQHGESDGSNSSTVRRLIDLRLSGRVLAAKYRVPGFDYQRHRLLCCPFAASKIFEQCPRLSLIRQSQLVLDCGGVPSITLLMLWFRSPSYMVKLQLVCEMSFAICDDEYAYLLIDFSARNIHSVLSWKVLKTHQRVC